MLSAYALDKWSNIFHTFLQELGYYCVGGFPSLSEIDDYAFTAYSISD